MENMPEVNPNQDCCKITNFKSPRFVLMALGIVALGSIIIVSILREKFVTPPQNQVTVSGRGKVAYQPDTAVVTLGVQIDKAPTAENALFQLNAKMNQIIAAEKALGIPEDKIQTQNYSLSPQYDYIDGRSSVSGYTANQQLSVKVESIIQSPDLLSQTISSASQAGANQVMGIKLDVSNLEELKQQARVLAIQDAKKKAASMASAAGIKLGKLTSWYENILQSPDFQDYQGGYGIGAGGESGGLMAASKAPQIPTGTQEIVIDLNLNYEVK